MLRLVHTEGDLGENIQFNIIYIMRTHDITDDAQKS